MSSQSNTSESALNSSTLSLNSSKLGCPHPVSRTSGSIRPLSHARYEEDVVKLKRELCMLKSQLKTEMTKRNHVEKEMDLQQKELERNRLRVASLENRLKLTNQQKTSIHYMKATTEKTIKGLQDKIGLLEKDVTLFFIIFNEYSNLHFFFH